MLIFDIVASLTAGVGLQLWSLGKKRKQFRQNSGASMNEFLQIYKDWLLQTRFEFAVNHLKALALPRQTTTFPPSAS